MLGLGFRLQLFLIPQTMEGEDLTQPPPTVKNGIIGTIDLHGSGGSTDLTDHVHLLPCSVKHDGPQPVSDYFKPRNTGEVVDKMVVKEAFFRGRKLQGTTVSIPDDYCGFVLGKKMKGPKSGDSLDSNDWEARARFGNLTYYNHDDVPSNEDALPRCFHWFAVADAVIPIGSVPQGCDIDSNAFHDNDKSTALFIKIQTHGTIFSFSGDQHTHGRSKTRRKMGLVLARETTKNAPEDVKTQWSQKRLPHNFEAIVKEADDDQGDLQRILRSGIFLNHKKKKYWVDKSGYNCFTVYARDLSITWSSEQRYWHWLPLNNYSSEADIAVASLQNVCWLEVQGKLDASHLSPEVTYEVAFLVMMKDSSSGWHDLVTLSLMYPGGDKHDRKVSLNDDNLKNKWSELQVGTFTTSRDIQGDIQFSMFQCGAWKRGLVIKGATIQPAKGV